MGPTLIAAPATLMPRLNVPIPTLFGSGFAPVAVNGSIALAKLANTHHLLSQMPYLCPSLSLFRIKPVTGPATDRTRLSITYILAGAGGIT